jgi:hypothetical protein
MNIKPILFSTPMVQAILEGRKTMTRRIVKPQPPDWCKYFGTSIFTPKGYISGRGESPEGYGEKFIKCQYGTKGDILWLRETWQKHCIETETDENTWAATEYKSTGQYVYKADNYILPKDSVVFGKWKPSLFMPKEACRLFLKITNVKVERLQDISEEDAYKEGCDKKLGHKFNISCGESLEEVPHRFIFYKLWQSINGEQSWNDNPYVWVLEFEQCEKPLNFLKQ